MRYVINLAVTPGNNYFFKRVIEFQVISFLLSRTKGQFQSLGEIVQSMSTEHLLIDRRYGLKEIRSSIEMIPLARLATSKSNAEFESFFAKIAELKDALKNTKITDQPNNVTRDLWDFLARKPISYKNFFGAFPLSGMKILIKELERKYQGKNFRLQTHAETVQGFVN